jgi:ferritin-like metal-binding protein YciE
VDEYLRLTPSPSGAVSERMQALLSRAVEDQVNEQREVQSLLNEVKNALAEVQRDTRVSPGGSADLRAELANHASETRAQLGLLDERLEALVRAVSTSAQVLQGLSGQLERVSEAVRDRAAEAGRTEPIAQVRHEIADLRTKVDGMEALLHSQVAALGERLAAEVESLRDISAVSTETVANHVDNAVLVLAEALLRRPVPSVTEVAEPETAEPEAAEPETAEPEAAEPEVVEPEAVEPEAAEPEAAEPEPAEPEVVEPEVVEPEAVEEPTPASAPVPPRIALGPVDTAAAQSSDQPVEPEAVVEPAGADPMMYDDPLSEIPEKDDGRPVFPQFQQAPYDLERALFGDRSRVFVAAESRSATVEVDVDEGSPPDDVADGEAAVVDEEPVGDVPAQTSAVKTEAAATEPVEDTIRKSDIYVTYGDTTNEAEDEEDDDDAPRRRPWWRAST